MKRLSVRFAGLVAFVLMGAAPANPYNAAEALYTAGKYDAATQAARQLDTAEGHALAARALLAKAITEVPFEKRAPVLKEAEGEADKAIARNGKVLEGHLQKFVAYGSLTRLPGFKGGNGAAAKASRQMLDRALALDPKDPWTLAALGGWHLEIVRRAPLGLGKMAFGASRAEGLKAFDQALAGDPKNVDVRYEYALSLLSLDSKRYRAESESVLNEAIAIATDDAYSRAAQTRSKRLLALLASGDRRKLDAVLAGYRGDAPNVE